MKGRRHVPVLRAAGEVPRRVGRVGDLDSALDGDGPLPQDVHEPLGLHQVDGQAALNLRASQDSHAGGQATEKLVQWVADISILMLTIRCCA